MELTALTKNIGTIIAKLKNNNRLIEELNKCYNPTFVEILEDLKDTDETLATMLSLWYMKKYSVNDAKLQSVINEIKSDFKINNTPKKETMTYYYSGCGSGSTHNNSRC